MVRNFISVSAVSNREQLEEIGRICREEDLSFPVVIGYQVSNKNINQGTQNTRQPRVSELGELDKITRDLGLVTAVHYYTKSNETIVEDLEKIAGLGVDPPSTLVQLNTLPPTPEILRTVNEIGYKIIFKVAVSDKQSPKGGYAVWKGERVQDIETGEVLPLIEQVYDRKDSIDYVMFDPSHGTNLELSLDETSFAIRFGKAIASNNDFSSLGLVYAGGINPGNVGNLTKTLVQFFPGRISVDVESGVRTDDRLDLSKVKDYLIACRDVF